MSKKILAALVAVLAVQGSTAYAAGNSPVFLLHGDIGSATHTFSVDGEEGEFDDSATSISVGGYYVLSKNIALGLEYTDFGSVSDSDDGYSLEVSASALAANVLLSSNLAPSANEWVFFGKLGLANVTMDVDATVPGGKASIDDSKTGISGGVGVGYHFTEQLQLNFSASFAKASVKSVDNDLSRFAFGLTYGF